MNFKECRTLINSDAYRYLGKTDFATKCKLFFKTAGFNYSVKMRLARYFSSKGMKKIFFPLFYLVYRRAMFKYGISIPYKTEIGYGLYIGHFGGIVVNSEVKIGNNVNISQGVTIGQAGKDGNKRCPIINDNVYIGPKATIVGDIIIDDDVAVGANSFVNKNIEKNISVGGLPAKKISNRGSKDYIHNKWEEEELL